MNTELIVKKVKAMERINQMVLKDSEMAGKRLTQVVILSDYRANKVCLVFGKKFVQLNTAGDCDNPEMEFTAPTDDDLESYASRYAKFIPKELIDAVIEARVSERLARQEQNERRSLAYLKSKYEGGKK